MEQWFGCTCSQEEGIALNPGKVGFGISKVGGEGTHHVSLKAESMPEQRLISNLQCSLRSHHIRPMAKSLRLVKEIIQGPVKVPIERQ